MYQYALINKDTLHLLREQKGVTIEYLVRKTKIKEERLICFENKSSNLLPTYNQAKSIARALYVPFCSLYLLPENVDLTKQRKIANRRTVYGEDKIDDESSINLAIYQLLEFRELNLELANELGSNQKRIEFQIDSDNFTVLASHIRQFFNISLEKQFKCTSCRQLFLYVRSKLENKGVFVQGFYGTNVETVRGIAIYFDVLPIIGINDNDRYPGKLFSMLHELVHLIKRQSSICNDMDSKYNSFNEEVFCNAVAAEVLVPKEKLLSFFEEDYTNMKYEVEKLSKKFSVSREVISRRFLDLNKLSKSTYESLIESYRQELERDKELRKIDPKSSIIPRNMARETIDNTSPNLSQSLISSLGEGIIVKNDIARYLGIKEKHVDKYIKEAMKL